LIGGKVFRADGAAIYTEPKKRGTSFGGDDLFGSTVIFSRPRGDDRAEIWLDNAERPHPVKLATLAACEVGTAVSIWGEQVAWAPLCEGSRITVRNLRTRSTRTVATHGSYLDQMQLSEGTLAWNESYQDHLLDLTSPTSTAVTLPDYARMSVVDDHRIARDVRTNPIHGTPNPQLRRLPFDPKCAPRLIGWMGARGFTPNGNGHADTWAPQFDVTKPLRTATLKITTLSGKTVRTLTGSAPDGSLRDLAWNGRSTKNAILPVGTYRWTLTGSADDGDGNLIARDGTTRITGTIEIDAT
jgi:hypothetical protein